MKILIDGQVSELRYLGSLISDDEYCENDIHNKNSNGK